MKRWLLRVAGATVLVSVTLALPSAQQIPAQQAPESPAFEVAALRITKPTGFGPSPYGQGTWRVSAIRLGSLLTMAFDIRPVVQPMVGLPDWAATEYYSIAVKAEDGVLLTREAMRPRMKRFLEERFKLVTHIETKRVKGYALVVANGGTKLNPITAPATYDPGLIGKTQISSVRLRSWSVNMDSLAGALEVLLNRGTGDGLPIVNETGLTGLFDLTVTFAPIQTQPGAAPVETDSTSPSLFTALQEQLGLRLVSRDRIAVDTLVIDHVEHPIVD